MPLRSRIARIEDRLPALPARPSEDLLAFAETLSNEELDALEAFFRRLADAQDAEAAAQRGEPPA